MCVCLGLLPCVVDGAVDHAPVFFQIILFHPKLQSYRGHCDARSLHPPSAIR